MDSWNIYQRWLRRGTECNYHLQARLLTYFLRHLLDMLPTLLIGSNNTCNPHANRTNAMLADKLFGGGNRCQCQSRLHDKTGRVCGGEKTCVRDGMPLGICPQGGRR